MSHPKPPSPLIPLTPVELDRPRNLLLDFNALAYIEQTAKISVVQPEVWKNLTPKVVRTMLVGALRHEDPSLTEHQVGAWLHMGNLKTVMEAVGQAWKIAFQGPEGQGYPPLEVPLGPIPVPA